MKINRVNIKDVVRYGPRAAKVLPIIKLDRAQGGELENYLAQKTNSTIQNHVCYDVVDKNGNHTGVMITGEEIWIGGEVIIGSW